MIKVIVRVEVIVSMDCMEVRVYNHLWIFLIKFDHQVLNGRKWWPYGIIRNVDHECQFKRVMVKVIALEPIVSGGIALQIGLTNSYYLGNIFQVIFAICKYHFCDLQIPLIFNSCPVFLFNHFNPKTNPECQLLYFYCNVQLLKFWIYSVCQNLESPHSSGILLLYSIIFQF